MIQINSDVMLCYVMLSLPWQPVEPIGKDLRFTWEKTKTATLVLILITVIITITIIILIMDSCDVLPSIISGPTHLGLQIHPDPLRPAEAHLRTIRTPNTYVSPHQNSEPASPRSDCCCMRMEIVTVLLNLWYEFHYSCVWLIMGICWGYDGNMSWWEKRIW